MCLAQEPQAVTLVRLELAALRSRVKHSTTEPLRSHFQQCGNLTSVDSDEAVLDILFGIISLA